MSYSEGYKRFIEENLSIIDKNRQVVPFKLNKIQNQYLTKDGTSHRDLILKARQQGFSSLILAIFTADFLLKKNSRSVIVADDSENAIELLDRVRFFIESYEARRTKEKNTPYKTPMKYDSKYELFNEANNSRYSIGTAQKTDFGRSKTITNLHLCVGEDTKIILSDCSTKKIKDIEIGDALISRNGQRTKVTKKWNTGIKRIKKIRLWLGNETIEVSPDHKISVLSGKSYKWKKAKDLTTEDYVEWAYHKTFGNKKTICIKPRKNSKHLADRKFGLKLNVDFKLGYFFGYYLAEGHITKNLNKISFYCHKDEEYYKNFIDIFPIKPVVGIRKQISGTRKEITYYSKEVAMFVNDLVGRVENKRVPESFLYDYSKEFLKGLYQGWKDGDGSKIRKDCCFLTTIQEKIARPMKQIGMIILDKVLALDYVEERFRYDKQTKPIYVLREHRNGDNIGKRSLKYKKISGKFYIRVKSIEEIEKKQTYEIEVSNKSHCYLTPCGIISNSEAAFYPDMQKLLLGAMQAVTPNGRVIVETTANGFNYFKEYWTKSERGETTFKPLFYPASDFYEKRYLEEKEKETGFAFKQEYPETPIEAFITSGETYFDKEALAWFLENSKDYKKILYPEYIY